MACPKSGHQVCTPPWPSCQHWAGVQSQQENLLLRLAQGGHLAASQPGSKTLASFWVRNLHPLLSCQLIGWFLFGFPEPALGLGNGPRNRNTLFLWVGIWHLTQRREVQDRQAVLFTDSPGSVKLYVSSQQCHYSKWDCAVWKLFLHFWFLQLPVAIREF